MPVSGASPITALTFRAACPQTRAVSAAARRFPNGSLQRSAMLKPAYAKRANATVGLEPDCGKDERPRDRGAAGERTQRRPGNEQDGGDHHADGEGGAEVGLDEDERTGGSDDEADRTEELAERLRRGPAGEESRRPEGERELHKLRRLEREASDRNPAAGAVDRRSDPEHG